jgi:hypothetical protein
VTLLCEGTDSQVKASLPILESFGRNGVKITFPEQHVVLASHLDLGSVLRVEQHSIFWLDRPDIGTHRHDLAPSESPPDCDRRRNQDPPAAAPLAWFVVGRDQHPIMEHADRQPAFVQAAGASATAEVGHHSVTLPTSHDRADDQQEPDNPGDGGSHDRDATGA